MTRTTVYCGDPVQRFGRFSARDAAGGVPALFTGRRASFSFNTRVAIRKACDLLGLKPGDEVLAPAYNCGSELDPLLHAGLSILLYPLDRQARVDPDAVAALIRPKTRAIYVTHYFGFLQPELTALRRLCDDHGLALIEDCALSLFSGAQPAEGRTGDIAVFCFYKFLPVIAGGALVINTARITGETRFVKPAPAGFVAKRLIRAGLRAGLGTTATAALSRVLRGRTAAAPDSAPVPAPVPASRQTDPPDMPGHYYFAPRLQNTRISSLTAHMLSGFDVAEVSAARRTNYLHLLDRLNAIPGAAPLFSDLPAEAVPLNMPVVITGPDRNALVLALQAEGIAATPWWSGYNRHLDFSSAPDARYLKDHLLCLPSHQSLTVAAIDHIAARFHALIQRGG